VDRSGYYRDPDMPEVTRSAVRDRRRDDPEARDPHYGRGDYRDDRDRFGDRERRAR